GHRGAMTTARRAMPPHSTGRHAALALACGMALAVTAGWPQPAWAAAAAPAAANAAPEASAADAGFADFDRSMLAGAGHGTADLSRFEHGNPVLPGIYNLDVYLNKNWAGRMDVRFAAPSKDANA